MTKVDTNHKKGTSFTKTFFTLMPAFTGFPLFIFSLSYILGKPELFSCLNAYLPAAWGLEDKILLLSKVGGLISVYFAALVVITIMSRFIFIAPNPLHREDPEGVKFFNRIMSNSVEQTILFLLALTYWTLNMATNDQKIQVLLFGLLWVFGRVLFIFGYSFYYVSGVASFRAYGFALNLGLSMTLILRGFGFNLI